MIGLTTRDLMYIDELGKKNLFSWMFKPRYRRKLKERLKDLEAQYKAKKITRSAFKIWKNLILKAI